MMKRALISLIALGSFRAEAQHWKPQDKNVWLDPGKLLFVPGNSDQALAPGVLRIHRPATERRLPPPPRKERWPYETSAGVQAVGGEIVYLHESILLPPDGDPKGKKDLKLELFRFDEAAWKWETEPYGTLVWPKGFKAVLLSKDRILAIAMKPDSFVKDGKGYPFAVFRRGQTGTFSVDSHLEGGLDKPAIQGTSTWNYQALAKLWMDARVAFCGDQVVLGNGAGMFWVFTSKGSLRRTVRLYDAVTDEALQKGDLWNEAVLGMQPRPDGDLLVSAHAEGTLDHVYRLLAESRTAQSGPEYQERRKKALDLAMWANPRVDWFVLDLDTGKASLCPPPLGFPSLLKTTQAIHDFNWTFKPDGNLQLYSEKEMSKRDPDAPLLGMKRK
jgi:hypothetical protein